MQLFFNYFFLLFFLSYYFTKALHYIVCMCICVRVYERERVGGRWDFKPGMLRMSEEYKHNFQATAYT